MSNIPNDKPAVAGETVSDRKAREAQNERNRVARAAAPKKPEPNDGDIANPVDATDLRQPPEPAVVESWGDRQAREAREAEKRDGERNKQNAT